MRHHITEQGSVEWLRLHLGIPSASNFHKIVDGQCRMRVSRSDKTRPSIMTRGYAFRLASEILFNELNTSLEQTEWMQRGKELEPKAVRMYEFEQGVETAPVGFLTTDDGRIGATPDRLIVGKPGSLEVKCPAEWTHLEYLVDGFGEDYVQQAQGQIYVGEFDFCHRYSYHPDAPSVLLPTYRDDTKQKSLHQALTNFLDMRDEILYHARKAGLWGARKTLGTPVEVAYGDQGRLLPGEA